MDRSKQQQAGQSSGDSENRDISMQGSQGEGQKPLLKGRTEESYFEYRKVGDQPAQSKYRIARQDFHSADPNLQEIVYEPPIVEEGSNVEPLQDRPRPPTIEQGSSAQEGGESMQKKTSNLEARHYGRNLPSIQKPTGAEEHKDERSPNPFSETYRGRFRNPSGTIETFDVEDVSSLDDSGAGQLQPGQPRLEGQQQLPGQRRNRGEAQPKASREHGTLPSYSAATGPAWKSDTVHSKPSRGLGRRGSDPDRGEMPLPAQDSPSIVSGLPRGHHQEYGEGERHAAHMDEDMDREGVSSAEAAPPPMLRTGAKSGVPMGQQASGSDRGGESRGGKRGEVGGAAQGTDRSVRDTRGARDTRDTRGPASHRGGAPIQRIQAPIATGRSASHYADSPLHAIGTRPSDFESGSYDDAQFREPSYLSDGLATSADMPEDYAGMSGYGPGYPGFPSFRAFPESPRVATGTTSQAAGQESSSPMPAPLPPPRKGKSLKDWDTWIPSPQIGRAHV